MSIIDPQSSVVVGREPCPKCREKGKDRSGDNLIRYEDGHAHCFSCSYHVPSNREQFIKQAMERQNRPEKGSFITLPADATRTVDYKALEWLSKYEITREELINHEIKWSPSRELLLFPIRGADKVLLAWQGRSFGNKFQGKWISQGPVHEILHIINLDKHGDDVIVLVEDIVSAIKVSRYVACMPLFGSDVNLKTMLRLRHLTKRAILWLDADKFKEAIGFAKRLEYVNVETRVVFTEKDPKECDDNLIKDAIRG